MKHTQTYKQALIGAHAKDTAVSVCFQDSWPGATHRTLRNGTFVRWEAAGSPPPGQRPGEGDIVATSPTNGRVTRYSILPPQQSMQGMLTDLAMYAGQGVDKIKDVPPAAELIKRLWAECLAARP
jgi:nitronate monooxygenase